MYTLNGTMLIRIDPFNKYKIRNFHPITSNSFQLPFELFSISFIVRLIKTINVIQKNSKSKLKRIMYSVFIRG